MSVKKKTCPDCGFKNQTGDVYCKGCSKSLFNRKYDYKTASLLSWL